MNINLILKLLTILTFISPNVILAQSTFEQIISTLDNDYINLSKEDDNGNYYIIGSRSDFDSYERSGTLIKLNSDGEILYQSDFYIPDSITKFGELRILNDSIFLFGAKGSLQDGIFNKAWVLIINPELESLRSCLYELGDLSLTSWISLPEIDDHLTLCGNILFGENNETDIIFFEFSREGDSMNFSRLELEYQQSALDFKKNESNGGYDVFAAGTFIGSPVSPGKLVVFDSLFNLVSADSIPWDIYFQMTVKTLNDSTYLLSGNKHFLNPSHTEMGIIKLDTSNNLLGYAHFGSGGDTNCYPGVSRNLDFITKDNIYYGGTYNLIVDQYPWQEEDSWIMLNNIDSNLNLNWKKYYGGDAFYHLMSLTATQDGGCLMVGVRYDDQTQFEEFDGFIIKVDSNGLLTSTGELAVFDPGDISVFPNPASHYVTISLFPPASTTTRQYKLYIRDIMGRETEIIPIETLHQPRRIHIDVSGYPPGMYFISLESGAFPNNSAKMMIAR